MLADETWLVSSRKNVPCVWFQVYDSEVFRFVVFLAMYTLVLVMVILYAFAEGSSASKRGYASLGSVSVSTAVGIETPLAIPSSHYSQFIFEHYHHQITTTTATTMTTVMMITDKKNDDECVKTCHFEMSPGYLKLAALHTLGRMSL